ncbi:unnamed protein product [Dicrocoelium dendriticum]|nr:unnamed protein product [Dicrocoelium dendriticum]
MFIHEARAFADAECITSPAFLLPNLAHQVVMELLDMCGVPHVSSTREADLQMAELAVLLDCPIVSNDSDFYLFQSPAPSRYRVIPLSSLSSTCDRLPTKCADCGSQSATCYGLSCSVYRPSQSCLNKVTPSLLPLLAVLLGNDVISNVHLPDEVERLIKLAPSMSYCAKRVHAALGWLSQLSNNSSGALRQILSGYSGPQLIDITKQIAQCIRGYFLDPVTGGSELANEMNLPTDAYFARHSLYRRPSISLDSISLKTVDEAITLLKQTLSHWEAGAVGTGTDLCFQWPQQLSHVFRTGRLCNSLIDALYVRGGSVLGILYEDLNYETSIYTVSEQIRFLNYRLLVELENRIGCSKKLLALTDGNPIESRREGKRMSTFSVQLPVVTVPRCVSTVECIDRFFSQYLSLELSSMVCDSPQTLGIICVVIFWLRHTSIKDVAQIPVNGNPVVLAFITCALLTGIHYECSRGHEKTVADKELEKLCKRYGQVASDAKRECVTDDHHCYSIEVVHQLSELQLVYVELQHLTTLLEVLCTCTGGEEDPTGGDSAPADEMRLIFWPGWVMFSSGRLLHWLVQALAWAPPDDRIDRLKYRWIPTLLHAIFFDDITSSYTSEYSKLVVDELDAVLCVLTDVAFTPSNV